MAQIFRFLPSTVDRKLGRHVFEKFIIFDVLSHPLDDRVFQGDLLRSSHDIMVPSFVERCLDVPHVRHEFLGISTEDLLLLFRILELAG